MRKLAVTLALASTALATPAIARDKSWYVGVDGGVMLVENIKYDIGTNKQASSASHDIGYDVDGNIGYDFGVFRVEAEVGYRRATLSNYSSGLLPILSGTTSVSPGTYPAGGADSALSFMVNGLFDFGDDDKLQGFVGGGVGVARVRGSQYNISPTRANPSFVNDSDTVFAYQGIAGVRAPITHHLDASIKYRFFTAPGINLVGLNGAGVITNYHGTFRSHSLLAGLT